MEREVQYLKEEASNAWRRGDFQVALDSYTQAIQIMLDHANEWEASERKELLRTFYSNRSAVYLKLNKALEALEDANKCCNLDPQWTKGFVRKGDALYALKRFTDCHNAYNAALRLSPTDTSLKEKCELAQRAIRNESSSSSYGGGGANGTAILLPGSLLGNPFQSLNGLLLLLLKAAVVLFALATFLPLHPYQRFTHKAFVITAISSYMLSIYSKHGRVTFTSDYLQRIVADAASIYLFLALLQLTSLKPHICAMLPIALSELVLLLQALHKYQPSFARVSQPLMNRLMGFTLSSQEYSSYERSSDTLKWSLITTKTAIFCMYSELFQAVVLTVELLFPSRSFIQLYLWTQFLRMRVMMDTSGQFRTIFAKLDVYISALLSHGSVPAGVRSGYAFVKEYLKKQVSPDQQQAPRGGAATSGVGSLLNRCSIM